MCPKIKNITEGLAPLMPNGFFKKKLMFIYKFIEAIVDRIKTELVNNFH